MFKDKAQWRVKCVLVPGQKGTTREYEQFGEALVCVRYRYNEEGLRIKTVELIVEKVKIR